jgi:pimeloyl-ACP methyl ester carboxylesterase
MPYVDSQGLRIHYEVEGAGPPLVLQHGYSGSLKRWYWAGYVAALRDRYRLILIDARGHGGSDKPHDPAAYSLAAQTADILAVLDALNIARASYWGFSMGGRIGFALADAAPERLHALVIGGAHPYSRRLDPGNRPDGSDPQEFIRALYKRTGADLAALPPEIREELFANDFRALAAGQQDWPSLEDVLPRMTMPNLLYVGDADPYLPKMRDCARRIPGTTLVELPGLDHGTGFRESGMILPHVVTFLNKATGAKSAGL